MRTDERRIEKYKKKIDGNIAKIRTDNYRNDQVKIFGRSCGGQVEIENKVKSYITKWALPNLHTNYYMLFLKRILSERYHKSQEEANITFNKWCARGLHFNHMRLLGRKFARRRLDLQVENIVPNLIAHYTFSKLIEDVDGNNIEDLSGNNYNGYGVNDTTFMSLDSEGLIGNCVDFSDTTTNFIRMPIGLPSYTDFQLSLKPFTLCVWLYAREPNHTWPQFDLLVGKVWSTMTASESEWRFTAAAGRGLSFDYARGNAWYLNLLFNESITSLLKNKWIFVAFGATGPKTGPNQLTIFVADEKEILIIAEAVGGYLECNTTTSPICVGGTWSSPYQYQANGKADEMKLYNKLLSIEEITQLWESER